MKALRILPIALIALLLSAMVVSGCGKKEVADSAANGAGKTGTTESSGKENSATERPPEEQLLYDYFAAINDGRYEDAYAMWAANQRPTSFSEFAASYRDYVDTVEVRSLKKLPEFSSPGNEVYQVDLDATYIKEYPAGSGEIPGVWTVVQDFNNPDKWLIADEGTGP